MMTESRYADTRNKKQRDVTIGHPQWSADGSTLTIATTPGAHVEVICGPLKKVSDSIFQVYPYECGWDNPKRSFSAWLVAILEGDRTYKRSVKAIEIRIPRSHIP